MSIISDSIFRGSLQEAQQRRVALAEAPATGRGGHREQEERLRKLSGEERRFNAKHGII